MVEDTHVYTDGLLCVITGKEVLEVVLFLGRIHPSVTCDRDCKISHLLSSTPSTSVQSRVVWAPRNGNPLSISPTLTYRMGPPQFHQLEHQKIKTRLIDENFASVMGECVIEM